MKILALSVGLFIALSTQAQTKFDIKIKQAEVKLLCKAPDESDPVSINASVVEEQDSLAIILKVKFAPGWHAYAHVGNNSPNIAMETLLKLPPSITTAGNWIKSQPNASVNYPNELLYEKEAVFIQKLVKGKEFNKGISVIQTGLYYQTCNLYQCLPPTEKTIDLTI